VRKVGLVLEEGQEIGIYFMTSTIRELLAKHGGLPVPADQLADTADLYEAGLSSFASVQLMLALEDEFDVEFPENLLNRKSFSSIEAIADALSQITDGRQVA
jgi:acyl carrier protein